VTWQTKDAIRVLVILSGLLYLASIALWAVGDFGWLYFWVANVTGVVMLYAAQNLLKKRRSLDAWRVYKLSAFPYLGVIFTVLCLSFWV
jgi:heme O synthase-like polyprenyltransferase